MMAITTSSSTNVKARRRGNVVVRFDPTLNLSIEPPPQILEGMNAAEARRDWRIWDAGSMGCLY